MSITIHVLDTSRGKPAAGMLVTLERRANDGTWTAVGRGETDSDGRVKSLVSGPIETGVYRLPFDTATYFRERHAETFYPEATIVFTVTGREQHYHVPLLLAPWGYTTYRGS